MATADTASIIACWPVDGCSWDDALKRAPAWDHYVNSMPPQITRHRPLADGATSFFDFDRFWARGESEKFVRQQIEKGLLILIGRDASDDQRSQIEPSLVRHLRFDSSTELMRGLGRTFYEVRVFAAPAIEAVPEPVPVPAKTADDEHMPTISWVAAEAKRMKAAGKIDDSTRITQFARMLEGRMKEAYKTNKSTPPVGWRHIKNKLPEWGLWPIKSIK